MSGSFDLGRAGTLEKPAELTLPAAPVTRPVGQPAARAADRGPAAPSTPPDDPATAPLAVPDPPEPLDAEQAVASVKLARETIARLDVMAAEFIVAVVKLDSKDPGLRTRVTDLETMGTDDMEAAARIVSRLLDGPVGSLAAGGPAAVHELADNLLALRRQMDDLNPGLQGDLFGSRRLLGVIPVGDRLHSYFARYQAAQGRFNAILSALMAQDRAMAADNPDLERAKADLGATVGHLRQYLYVAQKIDADLTDRATRAEATDPTRARVLRDDLLAPVQRRGRQLNASLAVAVQGYASIDVIKRNSSELIRGLDRVVAATATALRGAIDAAQNVAEFKLVLDQIVALTGVPSPSGRTPGVMDIPKLQAAFDDVYAAIDEVEAFRVRSTESMARTAATIESRRQPGT
jgi:uncharacterized protein YaaN involved in tellurite resistance